MLGLLLLCTQNTFKHLFALFVFFLHYLLKKKIFSLLFLIKISTLKFNPKPFVPFLE